MIKHCNPVASGGQEHSKQSIHPIPGAYIQGKMLVTQEWLQWLHDRAGQQGSFSVSGVRGPRFCLPAHTGPAQEGLVRIGLVVLLILYFTYKGRSVVDILDLWITSTQSTPIHLLKPCALSAALLQLQPGLQTWLCC